MLCPYTQEYERYAQETNYEYDADGRVVKETRAYTLAKKLKTCVEKDCGAWKNGECWFYADTIIEEGSEDGSEGATQV